MGKNIRYILLLIIPFHLIGYSQTTSFTTSGTFTWTAPCDVSSIQVECWGGGGGGGYGGTTNKYGGGGGGGGAYIINSSVTVVPGTTYTITVAASAAGGTTGSKNGTAGNSSIAIFGGTTLTANGGLEGLAYINGATGGSGGSGGTYSGGSGVSGTTTYSGGGGEGAATDANGSDGSTSDGGAGTNGGDGGAGTGANTTAGLAGTTAGGGGGGGTRNKNGGAGAIGKVVLTYTTAYCMPTFTSSIEPITNVTFAGINNTTSGTVNATSSSEHFCTTGSVVTGSTGNTISVSGNTDGNYANYIRVYIDWNQDGDFVDSDESFDIGTITNCGNCSVSSTIDVPCTATVGTTRMRVMKKYGSYSSTACEIGAFYGQSEDYNLTITAEPGSSTPSAQPTVLSLTAVSGTQVDGSFTAASPAPTNYLVVRTPTSSAPSPNPVDGTTYTVGGTVGGGTVVSIGTTTSFTSTGLTSNTAYWFWVYSYNGVCSSKYLTTSPLNETVTTLNVVNWIGAGVSGGTGGTDFNTATNWSPANVPDINDNANITTTTNATITVSANVTIGSLTILNNATGNVRLTLDATTKILTINGELLANVNALGGANTELLLSVGNSPGSIIVGGNATLGNNSNVDSYIGFSGSSAGTSTGTITFNGDTYFGVTYGVISGAVSSFIWDGVGTQTIYTNDTYLIDMNGTCQIGGVNVPTVVMSNSQTTNMQVFGTAGVGDLIIKSGATLDLDSRTWNKSTNSPSVAGGILTVEAGAVLKLGATTGGQTGSNFPLNFTTASPVLSATSTVEYNGTDDQTIYDVVTPGYGYLTLTNNSIKTATAGLDIQGDLLINTTATFAAGTSLSHDVKGNWSNSGTYTYTTGNTITFSGASNQSITGSSTTSFYNLTNSNSSTGLTLNRNILVAGILSMSGATANINLNGFNIDLSTNGSLTGETNSNRIYGTSGVITTTRNINGPVGVDIAGLGAVLTTLANLGSTTIARGHTPQSGTGLPNATIERYFIITPTTNTGLAATLQINYFDNELNGLSANETAFELYRSTDGGSTWEERFGVVNVASNNISLAGIDAFSIWTISFPEIIALPITLATFEGKNEGRSNIIEWETFTEINNDFFTIERTSDGKHFEEISTVDGSGNSFDINKYSILDLDFPPVINYYRLKQTDFDGQFKHSNLISIDNRVESKTISKIINLHGVEVDIHYKGIVIIVYSDNSVLKTIQNP